MTLLLVCQGIESLLLVGKVVAGYHKTLTVFAACLGANLSIRGLWIFKVISMFSCLERRNMN